MRSRTRIIGLATTLIVTLILFVVGTWLETRIFDGLTSIVRNQSFLSVLLFFSIVNLNAVLAFVLIFLSFRNAVKMVVERQRAVFGSSLRTRLVTLFLFFSLVPTLILLYISTKFVNVRFESWMPPSVAETAAQSFRSEAAYRDKLIDFLNQSVGRTDQIDSYDFVLPTKNGRNASAFFRGQYQPIYEDLLKEIKNRSDQINSTATSFKVNDQHYAVVALRDNSWVGYISPPSILNQWQLLTNELIEAQPGVELVRLSYYILLGALTVLLVFSALWLGVTIARELTGPIQALAHATEQVAQGNYNVDIDDVVSDDEIGQLARSFRSMVDDLRLAQNSMRTAAQELEEKAALLSEKTDYYASVLREVQAAVLAVSEGQLLEACNPAAENLFAIVEKDSVGRTLEQLMPQSFYSAWLNPLLCPLILAETQRVEGEYSGRISGLDYQLLVAAVSLTKPNGQRAFLIIIEDMTHIARAQRSAAWREVAQKVAHEIKNPLTPIKLGAQRLERQLVAKMEGRDREVMKESLGVIVQSSDTIKKLVDEFVSVAKMPQAQLQRGNILDAVRLAAASFLGNQENIAIKTEVWNAHNSNYEPLDTRKDYPELTSRFDRDQIVRAIVNLLSNALAASTGVVGAEFVLIRTRLTDQPQRMIELAVIDQGQGIPEQVRNRLFEPYFSTKRTGTGLGLVIVQQIAHEHGGQIQVASNHPRGTIFTLSLSV
jgi:two-component system nitrogen regulation sensor histidine kinase NtrY